MRQIIVVVCGLCLASLTTAPATGGVSAPPGGNASGETGILEIVLNAAGYEFVDGIRGRRIEMAGFDHLKEPGRPMLPEKEFLVLLPPGARILSLEVEPVGTRRLAGRFELASTPPLLPLAGGPHDPEPVQRVMGEWERLEKVAYADDRAYPGKAARVAGSGTLRKYSYARIAFCPFTYHAASARLYHHDAARVRIAYSLPPVDSEIAKRARRLLRDTVADTRAAELFVNFDQLQGHYVPAAPTAEEGDAPDHYDLVIVTTAALQDAISSSDFLSWKRSLGFDVRVVLTSDPEIAEQPGADLAERIREFLRAHYGPWGIEHVLLVGNASVPMRLCFPDPNNHVHDPYHPSLGPGSIPTDSYYADLSLPDAESWDLDGDGFHGEYGQDSPDFLTEVYVGRIPTDDGSRVTYTLNKLVRFEQDSGAWKRNALHAGAVLFYPNQDFTGIPFRDGAVTLDEIEKGFMEGWSMTRYSEWAGLVPSTFPWFPLTQFAFLTAWSEGAYGIVNWAGHGSPDSVWRVVWIYDDGDGVPETNGPDGFDHEAFIADWLDVEDDHPSIVFAVSCNVGYPEPNSAGNLGIDLLTDPAMGAAAGVMNATRYAHVTFDWPAMPGGAESFAYEFNRHLIARPGGPSKLGAAGQDSKFFCHFNYGWDSPAEYRNQFDYNLYGDPSMEWAGAFPQRADLLRNVEVGQCDPVTPPLGDVLPLDVVDDLHVENFVAGTTDPDPASGSALVFYEVDAPVWIWLGKTLSGEVRIDF